MKLLLVNILLFFLLCNSTEYKAVEELDLTMYVGTWYQTYGDQFNKLFQGNSRCSTADYSLLDNGKVSVLNKQIMKIMNWNRLQVMPIIKIMIMVVT